MQEPQERTEKDKLQAGELFHFVDSEFGADLHRAANLMRAYNSTSDDNMEQRLAIIRELLGSVGDGVSLRPPFYCDFGYNIRLGCGVFANFGCVFQDIARIDIGDGCQIGPYVQILTADHPRDPVLRQQGFESARPVQIGRNVWIGSGAILLPGISVGDDAIIGAGSVVTRDVPAGATVMGNPARPRQRGLERGR